MKKSSKAARKRRSFTPGPIAADEIDAADVAADLFMLHSYVARSRIASQKADPAPAPPAFTSQFARGITRRLRLVLVSLSKSLTDTELRQLGAILGTLVRRTMV